jgi:hypothetical protein
MKIVVLRLVALCALLSPFLIHAQSGSPQGILIADIYKEWEDSLGSQPFGSWRLLRGPVVFKSARDLSPFNRFETGVNGNPSLDYWSYGSSIFNSPNVVRDKGRSTRCVFIRPDKDNDADQQMGAVYVEWTSAARQTVKLVMTFQNVGTDVKGGDGMTIHFFRSSKTDPGMVENLGTMPIPVASLSDQPVTKEMLAKVESGQRILIEVDPNIDGYGDNLAFSAAAYRQPDSP